MIEKASDSVGPTRQPPYPAKTRDVTVRNRAHALGNAKPAARGPSTIGSPSCKPLPKLQTVAEVALLWRSWVQPTQIMASKSAQPTDGRAAAWIVVVD